MVFYSQAQQANTAGTAHCWLTIGYITATWSTPLVRGMQKVNSSHTALSEWDMTEATEEICWRRVQFVKSDTGLYFPLLSPFPLLVFFLCYPLLDSPFFHFPALQNHSFSYPQFPSFPLPSYHPCLLHTLVSPPSRSPPIPFLLLLLCACFCDNY